MPSRRPPLTEEQKAEKNAKLRERRASETADARERRLREVRERRAAIKIGKRKNDKTLKSLAPQAVHQRIVIIVQSDKAKGDKPRLILPKQSKSTPGVLLTWSFNQINHIPLAISAVNPQVVEPSCQERTTLSIICDSQSDKTILPQSSVTPESERRPNETPVTKSHTLTLKDEAMESIVATSSPVKTMADKSLLNSPQAAGKETSGSLHPAEVLQTCSRQVESSNSKNNQTVLPAQNPGTIPKSRRLFRPLRLPGSALVEDAAVTHPTLTAKANISSSVQY